MLITVSVLIAYGLIELGFRVALPLLPMSMFNNQCRELRTVGQTSKHGKNPTTPYIAIIGDSFGAGQGDWFADNRYNLNSRYQAAHVLQDLTGQDVVSFSRAGAGSYDGAAIYAINTFKYLNNAGFTYQPPNTIIIYFNEGNDISDNIQFMQRHYLPDFSKEKLFDDTYFDQFAQVMDMKHSQGALPRAQDKFLTANLISRYFEGICYSATKKHTTHQPGETFKALINGEEVWLPDAARALGDVPAQSDENLTIGVRFFERALSRINQFWPESRKIAVYLSSAPSTYTIVGEEGVRWRTLSHKLEAMVKEASLKNGFEFFEVSTTLRQLAQTEYLHGPKDWGHFNRAGYEALGRALAQAVKQ